MLPQDAFTGGFMSRYIIVEMPPAYYVRKTFPKEPPQEEWIRLLDKLTELSTLAGEMEWDDQARDTYDKIYQGYHPVGDVQLDAYKEREAEHILKTSMLLTISEGSLYLTSQHLLSSQAIIKSLEAETNPRIERLSTHPRMQLTIQIQDILKLYGELSEDVLLKMVYKDLSMGERQFYETLSVLNRAKIIKYRKEAVDGKGTYFYSLNIRRKKDG
jgi:DNA-binding transcriptional ArsR family regulator